MNYYIKKAVEFHLCQYLKWYMLLLKLLMSFKDIQFGFSTQLLSLILYHTWVTIVSHQNIVIHCYGWYSYEPYWPTNYLDWYLICLKWKHCYSVGFYWLKRFYIYSKWIIYLIILKVFLYSIYQKCITWVQKFLESWPVASIQLL